jgi:integrase
VREGTHVADSASVTVKQAGELWLKKCEAEELERSTLEHYRSHVRLHIEPLIGRLKLSQLNAPTVRSFEDSLRERGRSKAMVRKIVRSLGTLLAEAQERGMIVRNPVHELRRRRKRKGDKRERDNAKPKVGVDMPTPDEIRRFIHALDDRWRPLLLTAVFTGLRASELRGLRWQDIDLDAGKLEVHQRADRFNKIGSPKTAAARRMVPLPPMVINTLREWQPRCPKKDGKLWLAFPNTSANIEWHPNLIAQGLEPTMVRAGIVDENGRAKYTGMHALRHFYASWCASIGLSMKVVQARMGHSNIAITMDTYTHLFPDDADDGKKLATAEKALMTVGATQVRHAG